MERPGEPRRGRRYRGPEVGLPSAGLPWAALPWAALPPRHGALKRGDVLVPGALSRPPRSSAGQPGSGSGTERGPLGRWGGNGLG